MTKLSKRPLAKEELDQYLNNLWSAFTFMDTKNEIRILFNDLLTHTEHKMFAKRLEIARRLMSGDTYDSISKILKVSEKTIASISNVLANRGSGYKKANESLKVLKQEERRQVNKRLDYIQGNKRQKLPAETALIDFAKSGIKTATRLIKRKNKNTSAIKFLSD